MFIDYLYNELMERSGNDLNYAKELLDELQEMVEQAKQQEIKDKILEEMQQEVDDIIGEIQLKTIEKYKNEYNIAWCFEKHPTVEYVIFEERGE